MAVTSRLRPIVVGVDGSAASAAAATGAARQARRELRPVRLVLAVPDTAAPVPAAATTALDDLRMALLPQMPALPVQAVVRRGPADLVLLDEAQGAAALVVGAGGRTGAALGPVARAVTERAACPVLVDRPVAPAGAGVVVGVDGGPTTTQVLTAAAAQACVRSTSLLVVHCPRRPFADGSSGIGPSGAVGCQPLVEDVALLQQTLPGVPITLQVTDQEPVDCLVSAARTAELLVVVRRAPDESSQVGSTGVVVTARAGAPVLVVPVPSGQPSLDREWARRHAVALAT